MLPTLWKAESGKEEQLAGHSIFSNIVRVSNHLCGILETFDSVFHRHPTPFEIYLHTPQVAALQVEGAVFSYGDRKVESRHLDSPPSQSN